MPYLRELGVSHLYLSPLLQARSGSMSGYDVVDPSRVSEELGGEPGLRELAAAGLGVIADIVPNHMAACEENRFWVRRTPARPLLRHRSCHRPPSAFLRHRRARGCAPRGRRGVPGNPREGACSSCARGSWTACASTISTAWPIRPATCTACARRASRRCGWRRSCKRTRRCATGLSRAPSATSSSTMSPRCSWTSGGRRT